MNDKEIRRALLGFHAYDVGDTSAGIHDEPLRARVGRHLRSLSDDERREVITKTVVALYGTDKAIAQGYGWEDMLSFLKWIDDDGYCGLWHDD